VTEAEGLELEAMIAKAGGSVGYEMGAIKDENEGRSWGVRGNCKSSGY
jgi:hypothetical protein